METTINKTAAPVVVSTTRGIIGRVRRAAATAMVSFGFLIGGGIASASATTPDPTDPLGGSGDSLFTGLKDYLTGHLVPAVVGLVLVAIAVTMLVKWGGKAAHKA